MKLAFKFTIALLVGLCGLIALEASWTLRSEVTLVQMDMRRDHQVIGTALAHAAGALWKVGGEQAAKDFLEELQDREDPESHVKFRWLPPGTGLDESVAPPAAGSSALAPATGHGAKPGPDRGSARRLCTQVPVQPGDPTLGILEVSEPRTDETIRERRIAFRVATTAGAVVVLYSLASVGLGIWLVGRPIHLLIDKARRVGSGDFSGRLELARRDELSELARELNGMCDRLAEANAKLARETEARIATIQQLRHSDRLATVGKLSSGIAHELGTPLNVILARSRLISSGDATGDDVLENARIISEQCAHMTRIIRQLLDFARPRPPSKTRVDLLGVVEETLRMLEPIARKADVSLVQVDAGSSVVGRVDRNQVQQVISNLVMNGIQAMPRGGKIQVSIDRATLRPPAEHGGAEGEYVRISVRDEGPGIPEESLPHLFEPFFTTKGVGEGTGLGLSVALGIVREHGGWIDVSTEEGKGTRFVVCLPPETEP